MAEAEQVFAPTIACVRRSIEALIDCRANAVTPGYLCLLEAATRAKGLKDLRPRFRDFFERHLRVGEAPENKPYLVPFGRSSNGQPLLFNKNVAGSYAPSSIRDVNPLHDVVEIAQDGTFSIMEDHVEAVRERILEQPLPAYATACFLYRDYGFSNYTTAETCFDQIRDQFGFAFDGDAIGSAVFADDSASFRADDFQPLVMA